VGSSSSNARAASRASSMPIGVSGRVEVGGEVADAAMAQLYQVGEGGGGPTLGVEAHRRAPRRLGLHEHDVLVGAEGLRCADLEEQVAVDGAGAQRFEGLRLPTAVVAGVDERHRVTGGLGGALGAAQHAAEERVGDVGDQQRDCP
jgi:hypothetical protein